MTRADQECSEYYNLKHNSTFSTQKFLETLNEKEKKDKNPRERREQYLCMNKFFLCWNWINSTGLAEINYLLFIRPVQASVCKFKSVIYWQNEIQTMKKNC